MTQIGLIDLLVLGLVLMISICIGLYHGFRDRASRLLFKKQSNNEQSNIKLESRHAVNESFRNNEMVDLKTSGLNRTSDYLMANSTIGVLPIAFSLLASFYSATVLVGVPGEVYQYGAEFWISAFGHSIAPLIGAFVTAPFFAKHNISSVFEYFEKRFESKRVRLVASSCYLIKTSMACI